MNQESGPTSPGTQDALLEILEGKPKGFLQGKLRFWLIVTLVLVLMLGLAYYFFGGEKKSGSYVTEAASTGNLTVSVSASGTLQPTRSVDVGSEQSGTLSEVLVQENDRVKKGQLLAQLDTAKLKDAVTRSQAAMSAARAAVAQAQATVAEAKASLARMRHVAELSGGKVPAKTEIDAAEAALQRAQANESSVRAGVVQAEASLKTDETNLGKGTIRSPVDGVVLTRKVEPGQTVAASMTTPVLFSIAEDLTKMELQVKVDEADVSSVQLGQTATFTVSAWPGRSFPAQIQRVGIGSTITDNVVTYKTVLAVENKDLALRPGMTATASIITADRRDVLLVSNAALRFTPPQAGAEPKKTSILSSIIPKTPSRTRPQGGRNASGPQRVWVLEADGTPRSIPVRTGVSNGRFTEIIGGDLRVGMAVITDYQENVK